MGYLRLSEEDELLGGDLHYFAPIKFQGKVSTYTKGLQLTRLNTSFQNHGSNVQRKINGPRISDSGGENNDIEMNERKLNGDTQLNKVATAADEITK